MDLAAFQHLLARLYTDPALRARFEADPKAVGDECGLDAEGSARLAELSAREVGRFAASLVAKRRNEVEKLLPGTARALGPDRFAALFRRHAASFVPSGVKKHRDDAIAFAASLEAEAGVGPDWAIDLARLEAAILAAHDPDRRWLVRRFRFALDDLARQAGPGGGPPRRRATLVIWFRPARRDRPRSLRLAMPGRPWMANGK